MNRLAKATALAAALSMGLPVLATAGPQSENTANSANNAPNEGGSHQSKTERMKECMAEQKATNSSMTESAMKTVCKNQMKSHKGLKSGNDLATGPQHNSSDQQPR